MTSTQIHANEYACKTLKERVRSVKSLTELEKRNLRDEISDLLKADDMCVKNLLGRMYYEGSAIEPDADKAEAIFYDLAQRSYPPALYNLAYLKIKRDSTDAEEILAYLHGIMAKYASDDQWKYLVPNARDLGWSYIESLSSNANFAGDIKQLRETHSLVAENSSKEIMDSYFMSWSTSQVHTPEPRTVQYEAGNESIGFDTILSIIELGLAIANYHYSSKASEATRKRMALANEYSQRASRNPPARDKSPSLVNQYSAFRGAPKIQNSISSGTTSAAQLATQNLNYSQPIRYATPNDIHLKWRPVKYATPHEIYTSPLSIR